MKIFLHIGSEKTGSTTIQSFLDINKKKLAARGIELSSSLAAQNNVFIAAYAMDHKRTNSVHITNGADRPESRAQFDRKIAADFLKEVDLIPAKARSLVLSNEHCHSGLIAESEVQKLKELLNRVTNDVTIIVYLRRQVDVCVSLYSTLLKFGGLTTNFDTYFSNLSLTHFYNYCELLKLWSGVFGKDNVKVRLFERKELLGNDLIVDFCDAIELNNTEELKSPDKLNESLIPEAQALLLELNRFKKFDRSAKFIVLHSRISAFLAEQHAGKGRLPRRAQAAMKQSIFDASNAEVKSEYFPDHESLFSTSFDEYPK